MWSLALALLLVAAPDEEYDVLRLKDGRELKGFIVSETEDAIKFRVVIVGSKGETSGGMTARFLRSEIRSIERTSDQARDRARKRSDAASSRPLEFESALQALEATQAKLLGRDALRVTSEHFVVESTCQERFVREVAFYLEEVYKAYQQTFGVEDRGGQQIRIYLLADRAEYERFTTARVGLAVRNPAFYHTKSRFIVAYNLFPVEKEREIRETILGYERQAREYQEQVKAHEAQIRKQAVEAHREIDAEARKAEAAIRSDAHGNKNARIREVEAWKQRQKAVVREKERELLEKLKKNRDEAGDYISGNRGVLAQNYRARLKANEKMFESLFHEGFHAFSRNYLWKDGRQPVPRWIEEGLASYYEMSVVEVGELIHGSPHPEFLARLRTTEARTLTLPQVLRGDPTQFVLTHQSDGNRSSMYYAKSWALAHYMVGRVPQQRILAYVRATSGGADPVQMFELLMGAPIPRVAAALDRHLATLAAK